VKKTVLALVIAAVAMPALAQAPSLNLAGEGRKVKTDQEVKQEQEREAGYKSGLAKIPDAKPGKNDPWGGVRGTSTPAGQSKSSK